MSRTYARETCVEQCVIKRVASEAHADLMSDTKTIEKKPRYSLLRYCAFI